MGCKLSRKTNENSEPSIEQILSRMANYKTIKSKFSNVKEERKELTEEEVKKYETQIKDFEDYVSQMLSKLCASERRHINKQLYKLSQQKNIDKTKLKKLYILFDEILCE